MQIVITRQDLIAVLKRAGAAVNSSDMLSVRQSVLIVAQAPEAGAQSQLTFGTTDGQIGIICQAPGEIKDPGRALLNHRRLSAIVNELPDGHVELTVDGKFKVTLRSSASKRKFTMTSLAPEDFPQILNEQPSEPLYSVEAKILQQAASEVRFAIDKSRADGSLLSPGEDKQFSLVSMSGHAMAVATGWFTERHGGGGSILMPRNLLDALDGIDPKAILTLSMDDKKIFVQTESTLILAIRLQAPFPAVFEQVLAGVPKDKRFRVSSEAFLSSVKAVSVAADYVEGAERFVQIDVSCVEGLVTVATRKSDRSQGEDELGVLDAGPGRFVFHIDAGVLSQALRSFAPTEIDLYYDVIHGQDALFLKNDTLAIMMSLIAEVAGKPEPVKK